MEWRSTLLTLNQNMRNKKNINQRTKSRSLAFVCLQKGRSFCTSNYQYKKMKLDGKDIFSSKKKFVNNVDDSNKEFNINNKGSKEESTT